MDKIKLDNAIWMELEQNKIILLHLNTSNYHLIKEAQMDKIILVIAIKMELEHNKILILHLNISN